MVVQQERKADSLTAIEWLALKVAGAKAADYRADAETGKGQEVDLLVRIQGTLDVAEDGQSQRTQKPSVEDMFGFVLQQLYESDNEAHRESADHIVELMQSAEAEGVLPAPTPGHKARASQLIQRISPKATVERKGSVRGFLRIGQVDLGGLSQAVSVAVSESTRAIMLEEEPTQEQG